MTDIVVSHLYKAFDGKQVLSDFSAVFLEKTVTAVMGYSGVGKTTLLRCIGGFEKPTSGEILYKAEPLPEYRGRGLRSSFRRTGCWSS
mgnify:CR=1 FL=1